MFEYSRPVAILMPPVSDVRMNNQPKRLAEGTCSSTDRILVEATRVLVERGIETARLDAEVLLSHTLQRPRLAFYSNPGQPLSPQQKSQYWDLVERRGRGEPVAYIVGEKEFFSLSFLVDRSVLIPRPETEGVVEAALEALRPMEKGRAATFFDVGTGSGAIAVAILVNRPESRAFASDISPAALDVARRNAERHGVGDRLTLLEGELFAGFGGEVDLVVANPPYVGENERECLSSEVSDFEPPGALFTDGDGLAVIRRLIRNAPDHLPDGGWLISEMGYGQGGEVGDLLRADGRWTDIDIRKDLAGIPRVAIARKR